MRWDKENKSVPFIRAFGLKWWKSIPDKIVRALPNWLQKKLGLKPMTPEDVVKELADKEIERLEKINPNDPHIKELEDLKQIKGTDLFMNGLLT